MSAAVKGEVPWLHVAVRMRSGECMLGISGLNPIDKKTRANPIRFQAHPPGFRYDPAGFQVQVIGTAGPNQALFLKMLTTFLLRVVLRVESAF